VQLQQANENGFNYEWQISDNESFMRNQISARCWQNMSRINQTSVLEIELNETAAVAANFGNGNANQVT
jgi:hypothetical protein